MGKILRSFNIGRVYVKMQRQRSSYGSGWEYPVWVFLESKTKKGYGYSQDPNIYQDLKEANERFDEIKNAMQEDLSFAVDIYAPQIRHKFKDEQ